MNFFLYRLIPVLVNGMKYSDIDIILLKVRKVFLMNREHDFYIDLVHL